MGAVLVIAGFLTACLGVIAVLIGRKKHRIRVVNFGMGLAVTAIALAIAGLAVSYS